MTKRIVGAPAKKEIEYENTGIAILMPVAFYGTYFSSPRQNVTVNCTP